MKKLDDSRATEANPATLPETSENALELNEAEHRVVECILSRKPGETWEMTAKRAGICVRQLYTYRQSTKIKETVSQLAVRLAGTELPAVLDAICLQAKSGNIPAARLFLDYTEGLNQFQEEVRALKEMRIAAIKIIDSVDPRLLGKIAQELRSYERKFAIEAGALTSIPNSPGDMHTGADP